MSRENVEVVRRSFEAFQRGGPDAMLDLFSDDVITYRAEPDGATFDGKAGFRDAAADWTEDFSEWQVLPRSSPIWASESWFGSSRQRRGEAAASVCGGLLVSLRADRRQSVEAQLLFQAYGSPRGRWADGVGDVAGEGGDRARGLRSRRPYGRGGRADRRRRRVRLQRRLSGPADPHGC